MIDYDEDEEIIAYCDVCGEPLTEEDCNVIENFGGEGGEDIFVHITMSKWVTRPPTARLNCSMTRAKINSVGRRLIFR